MFKKYKNLIIKLLIFIIVLISLIMIYCFVAPIRSVVNLLIISIIIAYTLKPLRNYLSKKFNLSSKKSSLLIIVMFLIIFIGLLYSIIPTILNESGNFGIMLDNIEEYILNLAISLKLDKLPWFETLYIQIGEKINRFLSSLSVNLIDNLLSMAENMLSLAIVPITTYYFLADSKLIYNKLLLLLPTDKRIIVKNINDELSQEEVENEIQSIEADDGKININTADINKLKEIPGIGDVKANSIIMYRESNGNFKSIEDLKNVDGIGEKTFEKIKNNIKI